MREKRNKSFGEERESEKRGRESVCVLCVFWVGARLACATSGRMRVREEWGNCLRRWGHAQV